MKKALVMTLVLVLGLGALAFADGALSGSVDFSITIAPQGYLDLLAFDGFALDLAVDYTIAGWVFGSETGFSELGYSSQSFTATGILGAFSFDSTMTFAPMVVTEKVYDYSDYWFTGELYDVYWDPCWWQKPWNLDSSETIAKFESWEATGSVSIAGISFEAFFFLQGAADSATTEPYAFFYDGTPGTTQTPAHLVAVDSGATWTYNGEEILGWTGTPTTAGSGWKFTVAGTAGDVSITSYTYFNLVEPMPKAACGACGYSLDKRGSGFTIADPGCGVAFNEEYLLIEGVSFGCATVDTALKITCAGFDSIKLLVNDVDLGFSGIVLDGLLTFTTTTKTFTFTPCITMQDTCFDFEVALSGTPTSISGLSVYGVSFSQTWNGITVTSKTAFDTDNSCLFGKYGMKVTNPDLQYLVMVPVTGLYYIDWVGVCPEDCDEVHFASIDDDEIGFYVPWCFDAEYYQVWESFAIEIDGDSCCGGGAFTVSATTYFGDKYTIKTAGWHYGFDDTIESGTEAWDVDESEVFNWLEAGETAGTAPALTEDLLGVAQAADPTVTYVEELVYGDDGLTYRKEDSTTLFQWVESDIDLELGIGSAWTLTAGIVVDVYGWDSLELGASFEF